MTYWSPNDDGEIADPCPFCSYTPFPTAHRHPQTTFSESFMSSSIMSDFTPSSRTRLSTHRFASAGTRKACIARIPGPDLVGRASNDSLPNGDVELRRRQWDAADPKLDHLGSTSEAGHRDFECPPARPLILWDGPLDLAHNVLSCELLSVGPNKHT